jgi:hypothetical protein
MAARGAVRLLSLCFAFSQAAGREEKWRGRRVLLLYRGLHFESYVSRGRHITVDAVTDDVRRNHEKRVVASLEASGANITVAACTYESPKLSEWLRGEKIVAHYAAPKGGTVPNKLLLKCYKWLATLPDWDVLVSIRADLLLKDDFASIQGLDPNKLGFAWKELSSNMKKNCAKAASANQSRQRPGGRSVAASGAGERIATTIGGPQRRQGATIFGEGA